PNGVISLPTGKTPEYFIKWTQYLLENWGNKKGEDIRKKYGLETVKKPELKNLHFIQIDEFYPIASSQQNSFYHYVNKYYIDGFGLDPKKALLINSDEIPLAEGKSYKEIFPDSKVDLSLRYREYTNELERSEEHTSELQSRENLVCRLLLEKKKARHRASALRGLARFVAAPAAASPRPRRSPRSPLLPYTTLCRSRLWLRPQKSAADQLRRNTIGRRQKL